MVKVLVVEDKPEEREKARQAVEARGHYVYCVEDMHDAYLALGLAEDAGKISGQDETPYVSNKVQWDAVITDLHLPRITDGKSPSGKEEPLGLDIAIYCSQNGIPCVICTDVGHHHSGWINTIAQRLGIEVVDDKGCEYIDAWRKAVDLAEQMIAAKK